MIKDSEDLTLYVQKTNRYIRRKKAIIAHRIIGVMYLRNKKAIFRFFAPFLRSLLLSRRVADCAWILFRLLSRFSNISNDCVIILLTSISSLFSLSRFSCALWSLNSFFFLRITRSSPKTKLEWEKNAFFKKSREALTKAKESVLILNSLYFRQVVDIACCPIRVTQLILESESYFLQKNEHKLDVVLTFRYGEVHDSISRDEAISVQTCHYMVPTNRPSTYWNLWSSMSVVHYYSLPKFACFISLRASIFRRSATDH